MQAVADDPNHRSHIVVLVKSDVENVVKAFCGDCKMQMKKADEFHPEEFCHMYKAGMDPWDFARKVVRYVPPQKDWGAGVRSQVSGEEVGK